MYTDSAAFFLAGWRAHRRATWRRGVRRLPLALVVVGVLIGVPAITIARAEPGLDGRYRAQSGSGTSVWTISSTCRDSGCFATVVSDSGWTRTASLSADRWVMTWIGRPDGLVCADGTTAPSNVTWWWDTSTLVGEVSSNHGAACGNPPTPPGNTKASFSLVKL